jgi:ATP-dependent helicase/nuclease subunit A
MQMERVVPSTSFEPLKHEIVRAGAGAGKTYALTHKVMEIAEHFLRTEKRLPRLVVTTFTRKATQELRERLMLLALEKYPHLIDYVTSSSLLMVSTLHGVMDLYLKRYGANLAADPGYKVITPMDATKIARQTLRSVLLSGESANAEILETFPFNDLVKIVRQIDRIRSINPDAVPYDLIGIGNLFRHHLDELADELRAVALAVQAESDQEVWLEMAAQFDSIATRLISVDWQKDREAILNSIEQIKVGKRNAKKPPASDETVERAKDVAVRLKDLSDIKFDPEIWHTFVNCFQTVDGIASRFSTEFRRLKRISGALEIEDLELLAMDGLRAFPETGEAFSSEWDHWLIDEYQDTSPFQVELVRRLSGNSPQYVVGDPQQSIYLFRGARAEVFQEKETELLKRLGQKTELKVNRRSRPELLLFFNDIFSQFPKQFQAMEPFLPEGEKIKKVRPVATFYIAEENDGDTAKEVGTEDGEPSHGDTDYSVKFNEDDTELLAIADHVQRLLSDGVAPEDVCVLARKNSTLAEVATVLNRFGIPTQVHAASGFFDRREVRDALALLKFLVNPKDTFNLTELLRSPWFRVADSSIIRFASKAALWEKLRSETLGTAEFEAVLRLQSLLEVAQRESLSAAFYQGLVESGMIDLARRNDVTGRRESNIWKLISRLQKDEASSGFNPLTFIAGSVGELRLEESNNEGDAVAAVEPNRVNLMTIHSSKGLEFKHVVLPRLHQKPKATDFASFIYSESDQRWAIRVPVGDDLKPTGSLPEKKWIEDRRSQEKLELIRVLYVAMTRAAQSVFLSWTKPAKRGSWADILDLDFAPGEHHLENSTYEVLSGKPEPKTATNRNTDEAIPKKKWHEQTETGRAESLSVTQILEGDPARQTIGSLKDVDRDFAWRLKTASDGTTVHKLMELLKYPSAARIEGLARKWFPDRSADVIAAIEFVKSQTNPNIMKIIKSGEVEWGFSISHQGLLIEGQVDLWGRSTDGRAWIIDYKSGSPESKQKAFQQMSIYALALRKSGFVKNDEPLTLAAVYPFARQVFVEAAPLEFDLADLLNREKTNGAGS